MSNGKKVVLVSFLVMYFVPLIGNLYYYNKIMFYYPFVSVPDLSFVFFISLFGTYILFLFFSSVRFPFFLEFRWFGYVLNRQARYYYRMIRFPLSIAAILLGVFSLVSGISHYRYASVPQSLGHHFKIILLLEVFHVIVLLDVICILFMTKYSLISHKKKSKITDLFVVIAFCSLSNGTATVLLATAALLAVLIPNIFSKILFVENISVLNIIRRSMLGGLVLIVILFSAFSLGNMLKTGSISITSQKINYLSDEYLASLVARISTDYDSLLFTSSPDFDRLNVAPDRLAMTIPIDSFLYRLSSLGFPINVQRPEITSIARLNYLNISTTRSNPREGSSPGLISSFDYISPFPINMLICALYMVFLSNIFDRLTSNKEKKISWFGALLVFVFCEVFFQSPIDIFNILDNGSLLAFGIYIMSCNEEPKIYLKVKKDLVPIN